MSIIAFLVGLALPTANGWLAVRLVEGKKPLLLRLERWMLGCILGITLTMEFTFLLHILGMIRFDRFGFLLAQCILLAPLGAFWLWKRSQYPLSPVEVPASPRIPRWLLWVVGLVALWTLIRVIAGTTVLLTIPPFVDDVFNNWNLRGKAFYYSHELTLDLSADEAVSDGVSSYPLTVPMMKTWLSVLAGTWSEPLVNSIHIVWYLGALGLVFCFLRKIQSFWIALLGTYLLASIPLFTMHGIIAYADLFLSIHIFAAIGMLFYAVRKGETGYLRLGALATALLVFTKNEALPLYLPVILLLFCACLVVLRKRRTLSPKEIVQSLLWYGISLAVTGIPWIGFKIMHGLPFGNAKPLSTFEIGWQPGVLKAISINTFLEGNWIFLFPLFFLLLLWQWRRAFLSPLVIFTAFILILYCGQIVLYLFTGLSTEALAQTGYARGLIHLMPVMVVLVSILLSKILERRA